jgi:hypothetical protein
MTPLRKRMLDAMILRGFAQHTQDTYLGAVMRLSQHYNCSPDRLSDEQERAYLLYQLQERQRSRSTVNLTSCAVRFLICDVLGQRIGACKFHWVAPLHRRVGQPVQSQPLQVQSPRPSIKKNAFVFPFFCAIFHQGVLSPNRWNLPNVDVVEASIGQSWADT